MTFLMTFLIKDLSPKHCEMSAFEAANVLGCSVYKEKKYSAYSKYKRAICINLCEFACIFFPSLPKIIYGHYPKN